MANDTWTPPSGPAAGTASLSEMQEQRTDNLYVAELVMEGDQSASGKVHRHKAGTLAARPAAGNAGRIYRASDTQQVFMDDGTNWYQIGGSPAFDTFYRANSTDIGSCESGQLWTEQDAGLDIDTARLMADAATAIGTIDLGSLQDRYVKVVGKIGTGGVAANINIGLIIRWVDSTDYLLGIVEGATNELQLWREDSGATKIASVSFTPAASTTYVMTMEAWGGFVALKLERSDSGTVAYIQYDDPTNSITGLETATEVGVRIITIDHDYFDAFAAEVRG
jgi:hypothetical protein